MSQILLQCRIYHVERVTQKTPTGEKLTRDIVRHPGAVALVPVVPSNQGEDQICLINNYRVAVADTLVELPAGTMEEGEEPIVTAGRELEEETGRDARTILKTIGGIRVYRGIRPIEQTDTAD